VFAKDKANGQYRFVGLFQLSQIDFEQQTVTFRRIMDNKITIKISQTIKTDINIIYENN
jgi:hypothetical protein